MCILKNYYYVAILYQVLRLCNVGNEHMYKCFSFYVIMHCGDQLYMWAVGLLSHEVHKMVALHYYD